MIYAQLHCAIGEFIVYSLVERLPVWLKITRFLSIRPESFFVLVVFFL